MRKIRFRTILSLSAIAITIIAIAAGTGYRYFTFVQAGDIPSSFFFDSAIITGIVLVLVIIFFQILALIVTRPLEKITKIINQIMEGHLDVNLGKSRILEFQTLIDALDKTLASLKLAVLKVGIKREEIGLGEVLKAKELAEERYKLLFETARDGIFTTNTQGIITTVNKRVTELTGYDREEIEGTNLMDLKFLVPESKTKLLENSKKRLQGINIPPYEIEIEKKDGNIILLELNASPITEEGQITGTISIVRDISERKKTQEKIRASEEKFRSLTEQSFDVIFTLDIKGILTYVSPKTKEILGYTSEEVIGTQFKKYINLSEIPKALKMFAEVLGGKEKTFDITLKRKDNKEILVEVAGVPLFKQGKVVGAQGNFRDVTEKKKAEKAIQKKTEQLERFAKLSVGRERRMIELKKEIAKLKRKK